MSQEQLAESLRGLQTSKELLRREGKVHHTLIPWQQYSEARAGKSKAQLLNFLAGDSKEMADPEATRIDPKSECTTRIESGLLTDLEAEYWNSLELHFTGYFAV